MNKNWQHVIRFPLSSFQNIFLAVVDVKSMKSTWNAAFEMIPVGIKIYQMFQEKNV